VFLFPQNPQIIKKKITSPPGCVQTQPANPYFNEQTTKGQTELKNDEPPAFSMTTCLPNK